MDSIKEAIKEVGTQLGLDAHNPSETIEGVEDTLNKLGVSICDNSDNFRGVEDILRDLSKVLEHLEG